MINETDEAMFDRYLSTNIPTKSPVSPVTTGKPTSEDEAMFEKYLSSGKDSDISEQQKQSPSTRIGQFANDVSGLLTSTGKAVGGAVLNTAKGFMDNANQLSYGAGQSMDALSRMFGVEPAPRTTEANVLEDPSLLIHSNQQQESREIPKPEGMVQGASNLIGQLVGGAGPAGIPGIGQAEMAGASIAPAFNKLGLAAPMMKVAQEFAPVVNFVKENIAKLPQKAVSGVGKFLAGLEGVGLNERVKQAINDSPEMVFQPKTSWNKIYVNLSNYFSSQKTDIGKEVGDLKKAASEAGVNMYNTVSDVLNRYKPQLEKLASDDNGKVAAQNIISAIENGSVKDVPKWTLKEQPGILNTMDVDQWEQVSKEANNNKAVNKIYQRIKKGLDTTPGERLSLEMLDSIKSKLNTIYDGIKKNDIGARLLEAKGKYAKVKEVESLLGNTTESTFGTRIRQSLNKDYENEFNVYRDFFPKGLFNQAVGEILNESRESILKLGSQFATPYSIAHKVGMVIAPAIAKTGAIISGSAPEYAAGVMPSILYRGKNIIQKVPGVIRELSTPAGVIGTLAAPPSR